MPGFHLMHCVPDPRMHGLHGYKEVIDTVAWGLEQLGYPVGYALNEYDRGATNIVFGAQVLPVAYLESLPPDTIVYNFEQIGGLGAAQIRPELHCAARRFRIWEYSQENVEAWTRLGARSVAVVPVGFAPILCRIPRPERQDIDVLMYGLSGERRALAFHQLSEAGLTAVFASGLYGKARDELIARSRIVLNAHLYEDTRIFEIVRVSYLLANRKAVVAIVDDPSRVETGLASAIRPTTLRRLVADCRALLEDDAARAALEDAGFAAMSQRDIRPILAGALKSRL